MRLDKRSEQDRWFSLNEEWTDFAPPSAVVNACVLNLHKIALSIRHEPENAALMSAPLSALATPLELHRSIAGACFGVRRGLERSLWRSQNGRHVGVSLVTVARALLTQVPDHVAFYQRTDALVQSCFCLANDGGDLELSDVTTWLDVTEHLVGRAMIRFPVKSYEYQMIRIAVGMVFLAITNSAHALSTKVHHTDKISVARSSALDQLVKLRHWARSNGHAGVYRAVNTAIQRACTRHAQEQARVA